MRMGVSEYIRPMPSVSRVLVCSQKYLFVSSEKNLLQFRVLIKKLHDKIRCIPLAVSCPSLVFVQNFSRNLVNSKRYAAVGVHLFHDPLAMLCERCSRVAKPARIHKIKVIQRNGAAKEM
jgi:hypothetical protein